MVVVGVPGSAVVVGLAGSAVVVGLAGSAVVVGLAGSTGAWVTGVVAGALPGATTTVVVGVPSSVVGVISTGSSSAKAICGGVGSGASIVTPDTAATTDATAAAVDATPTDVAWVAVWIKRAKPGVSTIQPNRLAAPVRLRPTSSIARTTTGSKWLPADFTSSWRASSAVAGTL